MRARAALPAGLLAAMLSVQISAAQVPEPSMRERGQTVFTHRCAMCHREGQTGTFVLARRLGAGKALLEKRTDLAGPYIRQVVRWGLMNMPRLSRVELPESDMDALVAYLTPPGNLE